MKRKVKHESRVNRKQNIYFASLKSIWKLKTMMCFKTFENVIY